MSLARLRKSLLHAESGGVSDELCLSIHQLVAEGDAESGGVDWRADERERLAPLLVKAKRALTTRDSALAKARHEAKMKPFRLARQVGPKGLSVPVPTWDRTSSSSLKPPETPAAKPQGSKTRVPMSGQSSKAPMSRSRSGPTLKIQRPSRAVLRPDGSMGALTTPAPLPPLSSRSSDAARAPTSGGAPPATADGSLSARSGANKSLPALRPAGDEGQGQQLTPFKVGAHELSICFSVDPEVSAEQHELDLQDALDELRRDGALGASASAPALGRSGGAAGTSKLLLGRRRPSNDRGPGVAASSQGTFLTAGLSSGNPSQGSSSTARDMTASQMRRRRLERLVEATSSKLGHEMATKAQYALQMKLAKQQLQLHLNEGGNEDGHYDLRTQKESMELHLRHTLEQRAVTMGSKLSGLEKYNAQLVKVINDLRCAILPHRQEIKQHGDEGDWLSEANALHKQDMRKALDERDWAVKQVRYLQRQRLTLPLTLTLTLTGALPAAAAARECGAARGQDARAAGGQQPARRGQRQA